MFLNYCDYQSINEFVWPGLVTKLGKVPECRDAIKDAQAIGQTAISVCKNSIHAVVY